jgi:antitoxin StbD
MITPHVYEMLIEEVADRDLYELVRTRLAQKDLAVEVDIDAI